jgi:hypothetical protein
MGMPGDGLGLHDAGRLDVIAGQTRRARYVIHNSETFYVFDYQI